MTPDETTMLAASKRIIRVFPRRTNMTPIDDLARVGLPEMFDEADAVHLSVTWTWDLPMAERLEKEWRHVAPVTIGGPATGMRGEGFTPGMYVKHGCTITSRGCPNRCWFCSVWKREGEAIRELPIYDGWNVLDDNLLACSDRHVHDVFTMLARQKRKAEFTGGLEAKRLLAWHVIELRKLKPKQLFFAYDTADDLEPLQYAGRLLFAGGFTARSHVLRCYVLCGYPKDTTTDANNRMTETLKAGFTPMAMLYRDEPRLTPPEWSKFQRQWARPAIIHGAV